MSGSLCITQISHGSSEGCPHTCSHLRRPRVLLIQPVILSALLLVLRVELLQVPTYCINVIFFYQLILHRQTKTKWTTVLVLTCFSTSIYIQIIFQFQKLLFTTSTKNTFDFMRILFCSVSWDRVSLCNPGWPGVHSIPRLSNAGIKDTHHPSIWQEKYSLVTMRSDFKSGKSILF